MVRKRKENQNAGRKNRYSFLSFKREGSNPGSIDDNILGAQNAENSISPRRSLSTAPALEELQPPQVISGSRVHSEEFVKLQERFEVHRVIISLVKGLSFLEVDNTQALQHFKKADAQSSDLKCRPLQALCMDILVEVQLRRSQEEIAREYRREACRIRQQYIADYKKGQLGRLEKLGRDVELKLRSKLVPDTKEMEQIVSGDTPRRDWESKMMKLDPGGIYSFQEVKIPKTVREAKNDLSRGYLVRVNTAFSNTSMTEPRGISLEDELAMASTSSEEDVEEVGAVDVNSEPN